MTQFEDKDYYISMGNGDVAVKAGTLTNKVTKKEAGFISLIPIDKRFNVGECLVNKTDSINKTKPAVHIRFSNKESVDVVLNALVEIKKML